MLFGMKRQIIIMLNLLLKRYKESALKKFQFQLGWEEFCFSSRIPFDLIWNQKEIFNPFG
jgi:hypothetical protein